MPTPQPLEGRFDFRLGQSDPSDLIDQIVGGKVLVDGVEIQQVWFADTEAGMAKSYDVFKGGGARAKRRGDGTSYQATDFPDREVDCPEDGVVSETLRGKVELFACQKSKNAPSVEPAS